MTVLEHIDLVVNPNAGAGRAARFVAPLRAALDARKITTRVHTTRGPRDAGRIVRELLARGEHDTTIGVVGGDGSFHDALDGLDEAIPTGVRFAIVPAGTGGDLRRTLGMPLDADGIAGYLAAAIPTPFDLGRITFVTHDGRSEARWFGNIASAGVSGLADQIVNAGSKRFGAKAAFLIGTLRASFRYANVPMRVVVDGTVLYEGPVFNVVVANGKAYGGGMFVAPGADVRDGLFDVVVLGDLSHPQRIGLTPSIYRGAHLSLPYVHHTRGRVVEAFALGPAPALLDLDGEAPGRLDARFEVRPSAITMFARP